MWCQVNSFGRLLVGAKSPFSKSRTWCSSFSLGHTEEFSAIAALRRTAVCSEPRAAARARADLLDPLRHSATVSAWCRTWWEGGRCPRRRSKRGGAGQEGHPKKDWTEARWSWRAWFSEVVFTIYINLQCSFYMCSICPISSRTQLMRGGIVNICVNMNHEKNIEAYNLMAWLDISVAAHELRSMNLPCQVQLVWGNATGLGQQIQRIQKKFNILNRI